MPGITTCKAIVYKVHVECWHKDSETTYKDILHCHIKSCIHSLVHYKYTKRSSCCCRHQPLTGGWWMLVVTNSLVTSSFMTWLFMIFFSHFSTNTLQNCLFTLMCIITILAGWHFVKTTTSQYWYLVIHIYICVPVCSISVKF